MASWSPKLTRGLWSVVQGGVRDGLPFMAFQAAARAAGEAPDAATLSHLYSRAVGGEVVQRAEADYRGRVDPDTYLSRRPGADHIASLPRGFRLAGAYRQVVRVTGKDALTGQERAQFVNVQFSRLLSRGEAVDLALATSAEGYGLVGPLTATYWQTWRAG